MSVAPGRLEDEATEDAWRHSAHAFIYDDPHGAPDKNGDICLDRAVTNIATWQGKGVPEQNLPPIVYAEFYLQENARKIRLAIRASTAIKLGERLIEEARRAMEAG